MNELFRKVPCSERLPEKFGMYMCHVKVKEEGLTYHPISYCQWDSITKKWTRESACGTSGEVVDWLEPIQLPTDEEIEKMANRWAHGIVELSIHTAFHLSFKEGFKSSLELLKGGKS